MRYRNPLREGRQPTVGSTAKTNPASTSQPQTRDIIRSDNELVSAGTLRGGDPPNNGYILNLEGFDFYGEERRIRFFSTIADEDEPGAVYGATSTTRPTIFLTSGFLVGKRQSWQLMSSEGPSTRASIIFYSQFFELWYGPDQQQLAWFKTVNGDATNQLVMRSPDLTQSVALKVQNGQGNRLHVCDDADTVYRGIKASYIEVGGVGDTPQVVTGTGSPEGAFTAPQGSIYLRQDGGAGTTLYVKEVGSGGTGWAAK